MNKEDIIALVRAGFTREEIRALYKDEPAPAPAPAEPAPAEPTPAPAPAEPAPAPASAEPTPEYKELLEQVKTLVSVVQATNRINTNQPAPRTEDDILDSILNNERK